MGYCPKCGANLRIETICPYCGERLRPELSDNKELERLRDVTNDFRSRPTCQDHELKELIVAFLATASLQEKGIYENRIKVYLDNYLNGGEGIVNIIDYSASPSVYDGAVSGSRASGTAGAASGAAVAATGGSPKGRRPRKKLSMKARIIIASSALVVAVAAVLIPVLSRSSKNKSSEYGSCYSTYVTLSSEGYSKGHFYAYYGSYMSNISVPTRTYNQDQYKFGGYYSRSNGMGTKYFDKNGYCVQSWNSCESNVTLYAYWIQGYMINFNMNGGSSYYTITKYGFYGEFPDNISYSDLPTRYGYTFTGFYDQSSGGTQYYSAYGTAVKSYDRNYGITLYAHWSYNY